MSHNMGPYGGADLCFPWLSARS